MELFIEISMYTFMVLVYIFFVSIVYITRSNHNFVKALRGFTLPLMFLPILVLILIGGCMIVKDYVQTGSQAFKK